MYVCCSIVQPRSASMFGFVAASGWVTAQVEICAGLVWIFVCLDARITWSLLACTARRVPRPGGAPANPRGGPRYKGAVK